MIYLIGGSPKCGKTTLTKELSKKLQIPWISADTLQSVVFAYTKKEEIEDKFPWSQIRERTNRNNDIVYKKYTSQEIVGLYRKQTKTSQKAIEMVVESEINDGNDYIIEGYQIEPGLVKSLVEKFGEDKIKAIFLVRTDQAKFLDDIKKSSTPNDWIISRTKNEETYSKIAKMICEYGEIIKKEVTDHDLKIIEMDNSFDEKIREAIDLVSK